MFSAHPVSVSPSRGQGAQKVSLVRCDGPMWKSYPTTGAARPVCGLNHCSGIGDRYGGTPLSSTCSGL